MLGAKKQVRLEGSVSFEGFRRFVSRCRMVHWSFGLEFENKVAYFFIMDIERRIVRDLFKVVLVVHGLSFVELS